MIHALTKLDPIQQYYVNDHYLHSISSKEFRTNQSYSPKALIQGYWKKDYQSFIGINSSLNEDSKVALPQISTKSYLISCTKIEEPQYETSNSFNKILTKDLALQKYKIKPANGNCQMQKKGKEQFKIPGKIIKGALPHNRNLQLRQHKQCNDELSIERMDIKQSPTSKPINKPLTPSYTEYSLNQSKQVLPEIAKTPITSKTPKIPCQKPQISTQTQEFSQHKQFINTVQMTAHLIRLTNSQINNLVIIQFDELLGFQETSFYGLQLDFIQSDLYHDYLSTKDHYFQRLLHNSNIYQHKNLKELFFMLSKCYQIILLTYQFEKELVEFVNFFKLPISGIYKIKLQLLTQLQIQAIDCYYLCCDLQIKKLNRVVLIQTYENTQCEDEIFDLNDQNILFPYTNDNFKQFYNLMLPSLSMQNLIKSESGSSKLYLHSLYFIENFCQSLIIENSISNNLNKLRKLQLNYQDILYNIQRKLKQISQLDQSQSINQQRYSKKEMIQRIADKFDNSLKSLELSQELVMRNKKIIKRVTRYKQETINDLTILREQLIQECELLNYCQTLLDNCYYLIF